MSEKQAEVAETVQANPKVEQLQIEPSQSEPSQTKEVQEAQKKVIDEYSQHSEVKQQVKVESQKKEEVEAVQFAHVQPPKINNPKHFYKGEQKYNWDIQILDDNACLQKIETKCLPDFTQLLFLNEVGIEISDVIKVKGHFFYNLKVNDRKGEREVSRRYTQFILWRSKLTQMWPAIILATLPNKTLIGISEPDLIRNRSRYISRFLRSLSRHEAIYYSEESQTFLNNSQEVGISAYLQALPAPKPLQTFQNYKSAFRSQYQSSTKQDFLYRKDEIPATLQAYYAYFAKMKINLNQYMGAVRRLAESKQNYFKATSKLNLNLLADYEDTLYRWIYGEPLPKNPTSIMERMSLKNIIGKETTTQNKHENEGKQPKSDATKFGLYSSQAYVSHVSDTAQAIKDYNSSSWKIYDVIKFQLKEIDSVIGGIQQAKAVGRQIEHRKRTININKEQVEALNQNKRTLKTFFMDGNIDEKKTTLTNQNQALQEELDRLSEFYNMLMLLIQTQLKDYHKQRASFYRVSLKKAFNEELVISGVIMNFHTFEQQLFGRELKQRMNMMTEEKGTSNQVAQQKVNDESGN